MLLNVRRFFPATRVYKLQSCPASNTGKQAHTLLDTCEVVNTADASTAYWQAANKPAVSIMWSSGRTKAAVSHPVCSCQRLCSLLCLTLSAVANSHSGRSIRSVRRPEAKCTRRRAVMGAARSVITSRAGVSMPGVFKPCNEADRCSDAYVSWGPRHTCVRRATL